MNGQLNRLSYAYQAPVKLGTYSLLGSLVRAVGKGWHVLVIAPQRQHPLIQKIRQKLQNPQLITLKKSDEKLTSTEMYDLVLTFSPTEVIFNSHTMTIDLHPNPEKYDLISQFKHKKLHATGVTAITGTGKGKTTTAVGLATEAFAAGNQVAIIQWFKEKKAGTLTWAINEHQFPAMLTAASADRFVFYPTGAGFVGSPTMDRVAEQAEHQAKARAGMELAERLIKSGEYAMIVLDELVDTLPQVMPNLPYPLLEVEEVQRLLDLARHSTTRVVVTGRQVTPEWQAAIKDSIIISEVKHPWSAKGQGAVSGLDF